jgi:transcriptional regulator with XRE-family HTH domain
MGVSRKQIADYERSLAHPNDEMIIRLALTLQVSADTLLGLKEIELPQKSPNIRFPNVWKDWNSSLNQRKGQSVELLTSSYNHRSRW